jgi:hypothetical protein
MPRETAYWFPAKRFGWGWGFPSSWQGRSVLLAFLALLAAGWVVLPPSTVPGWYFAYVAILSAFLTLVCWLKGEPPRWRWGES